MAQSVFTGYEAGPFIPLGIIAVATAGTPVRFTNLIDPSAINAPESPTPLASAVNTGGATSRKEYTVTCNQIIVQGVKSNGGNGVTNNTGNVYVMLKGNSGGLGNRTDFGAMVLFVGPGLTAVLSVSPMNRNALCPYQLFLDADNNGDSALITLVVQ